MSLSPDFIPTAHRVVGFLTALEEHEHDAAQKIILDGDLLPFVMCLGAWLNESIETICRHAGDISKAEFLQRFALSYENGEFDDDDN